MSPAYRLYFIVLRVLLRVPLVWRVALSLHVSAGTYRANTSAVRAHAEAGETARNRASEFLATYSMVRRHLRPSSGRRAVFMVYEPRFGRIVAELRARDIDVLMIGRGLFDYLFQLHLQSYMRAHERAFGEYALQAYERFPGERGRYLVDCTCVTRLLQRCFAVESVILPKYNDDYTLELVQGFHDAGWTTVVYDREGTVTRRRLELIPAIVARQAATCDAVITYNETHKKFFERVFELSELPKPEILVMGNPASDDWFHDETLHGERGPRARGRQILYFAFGEFSYVYDAEYLKGKDEVWRRLLTEIHESLTSYFSDHPDDQLLYKRGAKGNRDYWQGSETLLALENARLVPSAASANALIADSDVVIAFQTTALADAMHTDKLLIYCGWGDRYQELRGGLIDFEEFARAGAILHARSPEELRRFLALDRRNIHVDLEARKRIRETFTTNPDGMVARRFADWVDERLCAVDTDEAKAALLGRGQVQARAS